MIVQMAQALALVFGSILGEALTLRVLGFPRVKTLYVLEVVIFVSLILLLFNNLPYFPLYLSIIVIFLVGFYASMASRTISTLFGLLSLTLKQRKKRELKPILRNLLKLLKRRGMKEEEIVEILVNAGFHPREVRDL